MTEDTEPPSGRESVHRIRLRGAWETVPHAGLTTHRRNFGRPRALGPRERLWLVCDRVPGPGEVLLNGEALAAVPAAGPFAADVTGRLSVRNTVAFEIASEEELGPVALEVRTGE